jgi:hypothetical protein
MRECLNDKELLTVHAGDGSDHARVHLETCLSCARRYRNLDTDLQSLVAVLRQSPPAAARSRVIAATIPWSRGLGWSLAASAMIAAFVCGRLTGITVASRAGPVMASASNLRQAPLRQVAMVDGEGADAPATYGIYIDDLMGPDASDQAQTVADGQDTDEQVDTDTDEF